MAKAVRIGMAGQSTGVEPSLIHPGIGLQNIARPALAETVREAKWTSATARRPENSSENLLYRNPLHVPAPANLRQARF
jgi:hypothetical protein